MKYCYSICKNYNIFSGCCANSLHCYLVYCFDLILCRHYLISTKLFRNYLYKLTVLL